MKFGRNSENKDLENPTHGLTTTDQNNPKRLPEIKLSLPEIFDPNHSRHLKYNSASCKLVSHRD